MFDYEAGLLTVLRHTSASQHTRQGPQECLPYTTEYVNRKGSEATLEELLYS